MNSIKRAILLVSTFILMALPFVVFFKAQALTDWYELRNYTPPSAVVDLASQDTMTEYARHVFYVNHPDLESQASQFRVDCKETEKTIVLGCYHGNQQGIFIYNVNDSRLAGVQQVTAGHEMLHAAYDRLSSKDKKQVDAMLQDFYDNGLTDQRVKDTIDSYKQSEPDDIVNEMHSVFGTEVANLPPPLEAYYNKYFTNRPAITDYAATYQAAFTSRLDEIKADDAQLALQKSQIDQQEQSLKTQLAQINSDKARLDGYKAAGQSQEYNSTVNQFNSEVIAYNAGVEKLKVQISSYNQLVIDRNSIANDYSSLSQSIDTRLTPQAAQ